MTKPLTIILTIISSAVTAQSTDCGCFNEIDSSGFDQPILTIKISNGMTLSVCGYEEERLSENEVLISEFSVFNCLSGEKIVEYGAAQSCIVKKDKHRLTITELKYLPAGENWKWEKVKIGLQQISVKENKLVVSEQKPAFEKVNLDESKADSFLIEIRSLKGTGKLVNPEEILGRLEILALNDFKDAANILYDLENYFNYQTDGAIAEQWKGAVATVKWIKK